MKAIYSRRAFLKSCAATAATGFGPAQIRAAPAKRSLRLAFFTDVHALLELDAPRGMAMAADRINQAKPDLAIAGGDLIHDGFSLTAAAAEPRWEAYLKMHRAITGRVWAAMGNNDLVAAAPQDHSAPAADPRSMFLNKLGMPRACQTFETGGYRFFLLDSTMLVGGKDRYHGGVDADQLAWLKTELAGVAGDTPIIVVSHFPLMTGLFQATGGATSPAPANRVVVNSRDVLALFRQHRLLLVLQGHLHVEERLWWRGTTFITGGAVCGAWWRGESFGTKEGFGVVTLRDERVDWQYIPYGWQAGRA
jgi:3',5'-cyclic AMP phosphodiesterase CpdA